VLLRTSRSILTRCVRPGAPPEAAASSAYLASAQLGAALKQSLLSVVRGSGRGSGSSGGPP